MNAHEKSRNIEIVNFENLNFLIYLLFNLFLF